MEADQFTLDEANALIQWLTERFHRLDILRQEYSATQRRVADFQLSSGAATDEDTARTTKEQIARQIEECMDEILDQGIIVRDAKLGLVDFPSLRNDRDIYLCWIDGEKRVDYWHEIDHGFSHRQPI